MVLPYYVERKQSRGSRIAARHYNTFMTLARATFASQQQGAPEVLPLGMSAPSSLPCRMDDACEPEVFHHCRVEAGFFGRPQYAPSTSKALGK
jgi:hypothetical protein